MANIIKKFIIISTISLLLSTWFGFCFFLYDLLSARKVVNTDDFSGRRIGVISGWEADYYLDNRDDVTLKRYDAPADAFLALNYRQIDALALDDATYALSLRSISNITTVGGPLTEYEHTFYVTIDKPDLNDKLNEFINAYRKTEEYKEYAKHYNDIDWIEGDNYTTPTGTGEVIKVGYITTEYPLIFVTPEGKMKGSETEFIVRFANKYNMKIEFIEVSEQGYPLDLQNGKIDICMCNITDVYRKELETGFLKYARMSDGYMTSNINCVVINGEMVINNDEFFEE